MSKTKKKIVATAIAMAVMCVYFVYTTVAYFTDSVDAKASLMSTGTTSVELIDVTLPYGQDTPIMNGESVDILPGYSISKTVAAKNTGTLPVYVRVKLDYSIMLSGASAPMADEDMDTSLITYDVDTVNWTYRDGYYYYNSPLVKDAQTPDMMSAVNFSTKMGNMYKDSKITFDVTIDIVQANNNGSNVFEATGWPAPSEGGAS